MGSCKKKSTFSFMMIIFHMLLVVMVHESSSTTTTAASSTATTQASTSDSTTPVTGSTSTTSGTTATVITTDSTTLTSSSSSPTSTSQATSTLPSSTTMMTSTTLTTTTTALVTTTPPILPSFTQISMVVTLAEKEIQQTLLELINCTDPLGQDVKVGIEPPILPVTARCIGCFQIYPCSAEWCLNYTGGTNLDFSKNPEYHLNITCETKDNRMTSSVLEIRLTKNAPPMFSPNAPFVQLTIPNTKTVKSGDVIHNITASDADGDAILYTMDVTPDNGNFEIGKSDGQIRAINDLSRECTPAVTFEVYIEDVYNTRVGPQVISTTLQDYNRAPVIKNLDTAIAVPEDTTVGASLYQIDVDDEVTNTVTYTVSGSPVLALSYFTVSNGEIQLTKALDYEMGSVRSLRLNIYATDDGGCISSTKFLKIDVTDVNEPPELLPDTYVTTVYEGAIAIDPAWRIEDPDFNEAHTYSIVGGNNKNRFSIDSSTGRITSLIDYDVDSGMSATVTLDIEVTDRGGLTLVKQGTVTINVLDMNDNPPVIRPLGTSLSVTECDNIGNQIAKLRYDDDDSSFQGNNVAYFQTATSSGGEITVLTSGHVVLTKQMKAGDTTTVIVFAQDQLKPRPTLFNQDLGWLDDTVVKPLTMGLGQYPGPLRSVSPAFVDVRCKVCPPTTTVPPTTTPTATTTTTPTTMPTTMPFIAEEEDWMADNLPWVIVSALLGTMLMGLMTFMCVRYVCPALSAKCCTPFSKPPTKPKPTPKAELKPKPINAKPPAETTLPPVEQPPVTPAVVGPQDASTYDFWTAGFIHVQEPK